MKIIAFLKNPAFIFAAMLAGGIFGYFFPKQSQILSPLSGLFLDTIKIFVLPIVTAAILSSMGKISRIQKIQNQLSKMIRLLLAFLFLTGALGFSVSWLLHPGSALSPTQREEIKPQTQSLSFSHPSESESFIKESPVYQKAQKIIKTASLWIYSFFFHAHPLILVAACIALGILILLFPAWLRNPLSWIMEKVLKFIKSIYRAIGILVPLALFIMISRQVALTQGTMAITIIKLIIAILTVSAVLLILSEWILCKTLSWKFFSGFRKLKKAFAVGAGLDSTFSAMTPAQDAFHHEKKLNQETVHFVMPMAATLNRLNLTLIFAVSVIFTAELYQFPWGILSISAAVTLCVIASFAGAGAPLLAALPLIALVLEPMGLPTETTLTLLFSAAFFIEPAATAANIHVNHAITVLVSKEKKTATKKHRVIVEKKQ